MDFDLENIEENDPHIVSIAINGYDLKKWDGSITEFLLKWAVLYAQDFVKQLNREGYDVTLLTGESFDFVLVFKSMTGREVGVNMTCQNNICQIVNEIDWKYKSAEQMKYGFSWYFSKR